nr:ribonuclease H-like domain-containing protein [Tanacetum cinerariifolium]
MTHKWYQSHLENFEALSIHKNLFSVIINGDSPVPTRVIKGVVQPVAPTTAEQRLARKNELKARGSSSESLDQIHDRLRKLISQLEILKESLSQEDINLKFLKSLPTEWRTHTLIWRNKKDLEEQSLDDLFNSLKIYKAEVKISTIASVFAVSAKVPATALPNVDTLSNDVIYSFFASQSNTPQLDNDDLKQIDADDLEEMDLKWQMAMLTVRARRFLQRIGRNLGANGPTSMGFDMSKLRDNALVVLRQKFEKAKQERDELQLKLEMFETSSKNLSQLLASQTNEKTGLGYNTHVFTSSMFDCDEMFSSDKSLLASPKYNRYQSRDGYHAVPPPYTGHLCHPNMTWFHDAPNVNETVHTAFIVELKDDSEAKPSQNAPSFVQTLEQAKPPRPSVKTVEHSIPVANHKTDIPKPKSHRNSRNRKACFVCKSLTHLIKDCDYYEKKMAQTPARNHAQRGTHQYYARMTLPNPQRHVVLIAVLTKSKLVPLTAARPVTPAVPQLHVTRPRSAKIVVTKPHSSPRRYVVFGGNPMGGKISGKGKIRTGKLDFDDVYFVKELKFILFSISHMCDKKNNVLFTDTECIILSPDFKLPDENQVLLRVPRENNMYNVDLKNIVPSGNLTCLFSKETFDESNLWHRRLGHINFKTMNKLVKGKKPDFEGEKLKSEVHVSPSSFAQSKKHDDKTKREAKGKSPVELSTRYRNLSAEFEDFFDNSINEVNVAGTPVPAVGQILTNNTKTFSALGHSNTAISPTHGK